MLDSYQVRAGHCTPEAVHHEDQELLLPKQYSLPDGCCAGL